VSAIRGWVAATPPDFRFAVKAQRSSAIRGLFASPEESVAWLTEPLAEFGDRLGAVLYRVPGEIRRDGRWVDGDAGLADARLGALLAAWPRDIPLVVEFQDPTWHVDETFALLRAAGAVLCITELPPEGDEEARGEARGGARGGARAVPEDSTSPPVSARPPATSDAGPPEPPIVRRTGAFLYLRLRLHDYDDDSLAAWAARIEPFLTAGDDVFAFFRHDPVGRAAELALELRRRLEGVPAKRDAG
jgi:uncharacterized protein YecE (DUF72 family)